VVKASDIYSDSSESGVEGCLDSSMGTVVSNHVVMVWMEFDKQYCIGAKMEYKLLEGRQQSVYSRQLPIELSWV